MNKSDVLMLAPLSTLQEAGYYGAALRLTYVQTAAVAVLSTVVTSRIGEAIAAQDFARARGLLRGSLLFAALISLPLGVILVGFAEPILELLYGGAYAPAQGVLIMLAVGQVGAALNVSTASFMLMSGRQVLFGKLTTVGLVLNLVLNWFLIPEMGAAGAGLATAISIFVLTLFQGFACLAIIRSGRYGEAVSSRISDTERP